MHGKVWMFSNLIDDEDLAFLQREFVSYQQAMDYYGMGDISRFDDAKELQKLSGLGLVSCSSGKHKGETRISHRGRKRLRYWLFQAARSAVAHGEEYQWIHAHYTTRAGNPLQKMQSLIVIACKILRVIYTMLKTGKPYDPEKLLKDIRYSENVQTAVA